MPTFCQHRKMRGMGKDFCPLGADSYTDAEFDRLVDESGMIDGEFHHAAAVMPVVYHNDGLFPSPEDEDANFCFEWCELLEDGKLVAHLLWAGDPLTHLDVWPVDDAGVALMAWMRDLARAGESMETVKTLLLSECERGTVGFGNFADFRHDCL